MIGLILGVNPLLLQAGANILVLEARDRVGGRTCSEFVELQDGQTTKTVRCDVGGAYIGPSQDRIMRIAKEFGVQSYPVYVEGKRQATLMPPACPTPMYVVSLLFKASQLFPFAECKQSILKVALRLFFHPNTRLGELPTFSWRSVLDMNHVEREMDRLSEMVRS